MDLFAPNIGRKKSDKKANSDADNSGGVTDDEGVDRTELRKKALKRKSLFKWKDVAYI